MKLKKYQIYSMNNQSHSLLIINTCCKTSSPSPLNMVEIASDDCGRYKKIVELQRQPLHQGDEERKTQFEGPAPEDDGQVGSQEDSHASSHSFLSDPPRIVYTRARQSFPNQSSDRISKEDWIYNFYEKKV